MGYEVHGKYKTGQTHGLYRVRMESGFTWQFVTSLGKMIERYGTKGNTPIEAAKRLWEIRRTGSDVTLPDDRVVRVEFVRDFGEEILFDEAT